MSSLLLSECNQTKEKEKGEDGLQMSMLSSSHGVLNHGVPGRPLDTNMSQKGGGLCLLTFIVRQTCGPCQTNANAPKMLVFQAGGGWKNLEISSTQGKFSHAPGVQSGH